MMKGCYAEMNVISVFCALENIGVETKMRFIHISVNERQVTIDGNGDHFGFMQIRYDERVLC